MIFTITEVFVPSVKTPVGLKIFTVNCSMGSVTRSSMVGMVIVRLETATGNTSVPETEPKSLPAIAVPETVE